MAWDDAFESSVRKLSAADVNSAMRALIDPAKISIVKAGDFKKAAAK